MISQLVVNGLVAGLFWALSALGFALIYSTTRFLPGAHGATFVVGAYAVVAVERHNSSPVVSAVAATVAAVALGLVTYWLAYRPLQLRGSPPLVLFLASLAIAVFVENFIAIVFGREIQVLASGPSEHMITLGSARVTRWQALTVAASLILFLGVWYFLRRTTQGKALRAITDDAELAEIIGIPQKLRQLSIAIGSGLAGLAAFFIVREGAVTPAMGFSVLLGSATATIIGGLGSIPGAVLGGLLIGIAQHLSVLLLPAQWQDAVVFGILLLFLAIRPQGFWGNPAYRVAI